MPQQLKQLLGSNQCFSVGESAQLFPVHIIERPSGPPPSLHGPCCLRAGRTGCTHEQVYPAPHCLERHVLTLSML